MENSFTRVLSRIIRETPLRDTVVGSWTCRRGFCGDPLSKVCVLTVVLSCSLTFGDEEARSARTNLLLYPDAAGAFQPVTTAGEWSLRRASIVEAMRRVMGPMPGNDRRVPLDVRVEEEVDAGRYVRRLLTYASEPGCRTPAYLCIPKSCLPEHRSHESHRTASGAVRPPKAAAVLCLHPTDNREGHKVVVGLGGRRGRQYAAELAELGYVTLAPAYPHLANYWPNLSKLGYKSGTMKAIWDNRRGLDLLETLPYVDATRGFGAIGHSLGGHNAVFTAVFDERISVLASSCGFDAFSDYYGGQTQRWYFGEGWCQIRYMPRLSNYRGRLAAIPFDFPELLGALAPRRFYVSAPVKDGNFRAQSVDVCVAAALPVYKLLGAPKNLTVRHPDYGHDFGEAEREEAYRTIGEVIAPQRDSKDRGED